MIKRSNGIQDAGVPLVVDAFTRKVTVPATERVIGVVGDHCSEQVTFSLARNIDNHDMTTCTESYVSWRNVDGEEGTDELAITEITDDHILFGWTIRDAVTTAKGLVSFSLHFECWDAEKLVYKWGTHTCSECEILDAINTKVKGGFKAIYIVDDMLVFADYTPVREETLELQTGIIPEGKLEITEEGVHSVYDYAEVEVKAIYEAPTISVEAGVVRAENHGLVAEHQLETPTIRMSDTGYIEAEANGLKKQATLNDFLKRTHVIIHHPNDGFVMFQEGIQADGALAVYWTHDLSTRANDYTAMWPIAGSVMRFITKNNTAASVTVVGHPLAVLGSAELLGGGMSCTQITVPVVDEGEAVEINMY